MKKTIAIILIALFLSACVAPDAKTSAPSSTDNGQVQLEMPDPTATPVPTPVLLEKRVALPVVVSHNAQFLKELDVEADADFQTEMETPIAELVSPEDDAYYVEFNQDRMNGLQLDRPDMPTYMWYINGSHALKIASVVVEFDLLETIHPLHPGFFDYDKGYYITLQYAQAIRRAPKGGESQLTGDILPVEIPELGEDMRQYVNQEGVHVTITIPYSEFQGAAKDLTLQFMPGTTFANLSASLWGADAINEAIVSDVSQKVNRQEHKLLSEVLSELNVPRSSLSGPSGTEAILNEVSSMIWRTNGEGQTINPDGSINMPVSFYDLGEYADEVSGKYAVVPEGLVPAFLTISSCNYLGNIRDNMDIAIEHKRNLVDFAFEHLMDETGQFYGVYDFEQSQTVATDRRSPALPILSSMCASICGMTDTSVLSDQEIKLILNSIIKNEIVRVGDKLYYAPHGIDADGVMDLNLSDFYISDALISILIDYSVDEDSLDEKYGVAMILEGYINSLRLVVEAQEQNETRLPSSKLTVIFKDGGDSYVLLPSDTFDINNAFFVNTDTISTMSDRFPGGDGDLSDLKLEATQQYIAKRLSAGKGGALDETQKRYIRECERQYAEYYNIYEIQTTLYKSFLHVYNFLQVQPTETAYAPKYNVHTGKMIEAPADMLSAEFSDYMAPMVRRIGTPATLMNYNLLVGVFNDETEMVETAKVIAFSYERWTGEGVFRSQGIDRYDPDLYADNGFNVWGFDSLYPMGGCNTSFRSSEPFYNRLGFNFSREGWLEYTMRKLNENIRNDKNHVKPNDEFPLFYDHIPKVEID